MKKFKITYADELSNGEPRTTYYVGRDSMTEYDVAGFFGLLGSDVEWYKIEIVDDYED